MQTHWEAESFTVFPDSPSLDPFCKIVTDGTGLYYYADRERRSG